MLLVVVLSVAGSAVGVDHPVSFEVGGFWQAGYGFFPEDEIDSRHTFFLSNARINVVGQLPGDRVSLLISGDAMSNTRPLGRRYRLGGEMDSDAPNPVPVLLDAALKLHFSSLNLDLEAGRFVPSWGLLMSASPADWGTIMPPLYLHGDGASFGVFRQVGVAASIGLSSAVSVKGGVFNGGKNGFVDTDDPKDLLLGLRFESPLRWAIDTSVRFGFGRTPVPTVDPAAVTVSINETSIMPIVEMRYQDRGWDAMVGGTMRYVRRDAPHPMPHERTLAGYVHLGVMMIGDWFELVGRFDAMDSSNQVAGDTHLRWTGGTHFRLFDGGTFLRVNYFLERFGATWGMCQYYLEAEACLGNVVGQQPAAAKRTANTLLLVIGSDIYTL